MAETVLTEVYGLLKGIGAVSSEAEFSKDWLGRSECYMRWLRCRGKTASTGAVAICASKLQHYGNSMCESAVHNKLGQQFLQLSAECHNMINKEARSVWLVL